MYHYVTTLLQIYVFFELLQNHMRVTTYIVNAYFNIWMIALTCEDRCWERRESLQL